VPLGSYRRIDPASVHETIVRLEARIGARFPEAGLRKVAQELIAVWPTGAACQLVGTRAADVVCVGEGSERTLIWRFGVDAGPTNPLAVLEVGRRSGVSADGRFVALWGRDALVVVDLDRAQALRRPLPPDVGVPAQLIPLADRVIALFRRPRTAPVVEVFDTRW